MAFETYLSSGYCHEAAANDPRHGIAELVLYNPLPAPCAATVTAYFQERAPHTLPPVQVQPETNALLILPRDAPAIFTDCGFWGARVASVTPLVVNGIDGVNVTVGGPMFSGACTTFRGTKLHHEWHYPDGLWLEWNKHYKGDLSKAPFPFNELEHYHFLNPHPRDAHVEMTLRFTQHEQTTLRFAVPAERVLVWDNLDKVPFNRGYGVKIVADQPISTSAVRYIYGLRGVDEWGMHVHCAMYGVPGPIESGLGEQ